MAEVCEPQQRSVLDGDLKVFEHLEDRRLLPILAEACALRRMASQMVWEMEEGDCERQWDGQETKRKDNVIFQNTHFYRRHVNFYQDVSPTDITFE